MSNSKILIPSTKIYLAKSKIAGRGVFARVSIKKDELIEICPVIVIPHNEQNIINPDLGRYVFKWRVTGRDTKAIVMGFGSFYNHSLEPNANHIESLIDRTMSFFALRDIEEGEEITHNYGYQILPEMIKP